LTGPQKKEKAVCKAALVDLDDQTSAMMRDSFKQFRISAVDVGTKDAAWVAGEKFDACVLRLEPGCEQLLESLRGSRLNRNMVIYGISMPGQHLRQVSKYGINVMLTHPLDRQAALKVVRSTHLLVLHEFRRYVRVPVITEVQVVFERERYSATSIELSGGGMSMATTSKFNSGQNVELTFSLPNAQPISCAAVVSWLDPKEGSIGVRFDPTDERRSLIKRWIEDYLEI
jgi:Tfp pilus assembly protein PilZ